MNKTFAVLTAAAALMAASPAFAQDRSSNTFGGASFESAPEGYRSGLFRDGFRFDVAPQGYRYDDGFTRSNRQFRQYNSPGNFMNQWPRESGTQKRG